MPPISEAVRQDHALIKRAFRHLIASEPDDRHPDEFVWALDRYLIVDDLVVAPALEHHIAHGGERHRRLSDDFDSVSRDGTSWALGRLRSIQTDKVSDKCKATPHAKIQPS